MVKHDIETNLPFISGPSRVPKYAPAPTFKIQGDDEQYFAIEVTTESKLFDREAYGYERDDANFYASWREGLVIGECFQLPAPVWANFRDAERLYYRLLTSKNPSSWVDFYTTTPDSELETAPFVVIDHSEVSSNGGSYEDTSEVPVITGPATFDRGDTPPTFQIHAGPHRYYAVELATDALLFDRAHHEAERTSENFFGSWEAGLQYASDDSEYQIPVEVWNRLRNAERLFYRVVTADAPDPMWPGFATSLNDSGWASAPYITLAPPDEPSVQSDARGDASEIESSSKPVMEEDNSTEPETLEDTHSTGGPDSIQSLLQDIRTFTNAVEAALWAFVREEDLAQNPLLQMQLVNEAAGVKAGAKKRSKALHTLLQDTFVNLPASENSPRVLDTLRLTFFERPPDADSTEAIIAAVGVAPSTYRRYLRRGIKTLAQALHAKETAEKK